MQAQDNNEYDIINSVFSGDKKKTSLYSLPFRGKEEGGNK
jgi:hypothetical protein